MSVVGCSPPLGYIRGFRRSFQDRMSAQPGFILCPPPTLLCTALYFILYTVYFYSAHHPPCSALLFTLYLHSAAHQAHWSALLYTLFCLLILCPPPTLLPYTYTLTTTHPPITLLCTAAVPQPCTLGSAQHCMLYSTTADFILCQSKAYTLLTRPAPMLCTVLEDLQCLLF